MIKAKNIYQSLGDLKSAELLIKAALVKVTQDEVYESEVSGIMAGLLKTVQETILALEGVNLEVEGAKPVKSADWFKNRDVLLYTGVIADCGIKAKVTNLPVIVMDTTRQHEGIVGISLLSRALDMALQLVTEVEWQTWYQEVDTNLLKAYDEDAVFSVEPSNKVIEYEVGEVALFNGVCKDGNYQVIVRDMPVKILNEVIMSDNSRIYTVMLEDNLTGEFDDDFEEGFRWNTWQQDVAGVNLRKMDGPFDMRISTRSYITK